MPKFTTAKQVIKGTVVPVTSRSKHPLMVLAKIDDLLSSAQQELGEHLLTNEMKNSNVKSYANKLFNKLESIRRELLEEARMSHMR